MGFGRNLLTTILIIETARRTERWREGNPLTSGRSRS